MIENSLKNGKPQQKLQSYSFIKLIYQMFNLVFIKNFSRKYKNLFCITLRIVASEDLIRPINN